MHGTQAYYPENQDNNNGKKYNIYNNNKVLNKWRDMACSQTENLTS